MLYLVAVPARGVVEGAQAALNLVNFGVTRVEVALRIRAVPKIDFKYSYTLVRLLLGFGKPEIYRKSIEFRRITIYTLGNIQKRVEIKS